MSVSIYAAFLLTFATSSLADIAYNITYFPGEVKKIVEDHQVCIEFNIQTFLADGLLNVTLEYEVLSDNVVLHNSSFNIENNSTIFNDSFCMTAKHVGRAQVLPKLMYYVNGAKKMKALQPMEVAVWRSAKMNSMARMYKHILTVVVALALFLMGTQLEKEQLLSELTHPFILSIAFCCQFMIMPLFAFLLGELMLKSDVALYFGLYVLGCSPGGGASNLVTIIVDGNLNLSATMTFFSNIGALFMMPLWLYTLGEMYILKGQSNIHVPFIQILKTLALIFFPTMAGIVVRHCWPKFGSLVGKYIKPIVMVMVSGTQLFGCYANNHMFRLFSWRVVIGTFLLPWGGFFLAGIVAYILKQDWKNIRTIAIETGIQAAAIAVVVIVQSLDHPDSDIAMVIPFCAIILVNIQMIIAAIVWFIFHKYRSGDETETVEQLENIVAMEVQSLEHNNIKV